MTAPRRHPHKKIRVKEDKDQEEEEKNKRRRDDGKCALHRDTLAKRSFSRKRMESKKRGRAEEGGEGKEENSTSSTFKPPKGAVRIPGMEAGGALGKEFLQNLKLKNNTNNTKGEEEEVGDEATREQSTPAAPKPAWMIELAAKKAAARAKEEE